jgi:hypothetical protein
VTLTASSTTVLFKGNSLGGNVAFNIDDISLTPLLLTRLLPPGAPVNPLNVAAAIDNFSNNGGTLPSGFLTLFNLSPSQLQAALTQASGEPATDAEKGAFNLMTQFLGVMLDPYV